MFTYPLTGIRCSYTSSQITICSSSSFVFLFASGSLQLCLPLPFCSDNVLLSGYVTKLGAVVKNWKLRWMVLYKDGKQNAFDQVGPLAVCPQGEPSKMSRQTRVLQKTATAWRRASGTIGHY